jgi:hypothetical protein
MEPFEKHPADIGGLNATGSGLLRCAAEAIDNSGLTQRQYQPAIASWHGMGAPELQAAPAPLLSRADDTRGALVWAAVVSRYWAGQVETFNGEVDRILARFNGLGPAYGLTGDPTDDEIAQARAAALHQARAEWWRAYNTHILDGEDDAVSMLRDGPNEAAIVKLEGLERIAQILGWIVKVGRPGLALLFLWFAIDAYRRAAGYAGRFGARQLSGYARNWGRWKVWAKWASRVAKAGAIGAAGMAAWDQWRRDSGRGYDNWERGGRAAVSGVSAGAGSWVGATVGRMAGAGLVGLVTTNPVAGAIGGVVGGIAGSVGGGIGGERVGRKVNDHTKFGERIGGAVRDTSRNVGNKIDEIGNGIKRNLPTPSNPIPPWLPRPPAWPLPQSTR